jgi:hypothetical protein
MAIKEYLVARGFEILETFIAEHWDEIVIAGKDGLQKLILMLKQRLGLIPVGADGLKGEDFSGELCVGFGAILDNQLPVSGCEPDCETDCPPCPPTDAAAPQE